ncbi:ATP-binding protein [Variovorax sp. dw_308]|uniref:PAS domain-containing sensor histidine kinase n=1 Tax=Variovorax sp. dw_308 TaxID=2721546 RepID=UPI001C441F71|nr:ATP-binding protein [Variovorax sp. dw_308]
MENGYSRFADALPGLVWTALPDGHVDFLNQRWHAYTGQRHDVALGHDWTASVHPDDLAEWMQRWSAMLAGKPCEMDVRLRRHDGVFRWFQFRAAAWRDAGGAIVKWCGVLTDIDHAKRAEEALGKLRSELAQVARVTSLGALTASIAHEVNQPLSGIITNASTCLRMLGTDPPNIDGARETARRTIRDGHRASDVITRLRALFGRHSPPAEWVDLNEATREVMALSSSELHRERVIPSSELADDLPSVSGDRAQLQQVILYLLLNALEAMRTVVDRPRQLMVKTNRDEGDCVRLTVKDAGIGIDPQNMERLFDAFYTTKSEGMGIGLSVSRSIIESHQGRLWAAANDGPGASFAFSIPTHPESAARFQGSAAIRMDMAMDAPRQRAGASQ